MTEKEKTVALYPAETRRRERFDRKSVAVAEKMLRRVEGLSHRPEALTPFLETLSDVFVDREDAIRPEGMPTVGTYCVMVPPELVYALGAMPVKLCGGSYTAFNIGDDTAPRDACPLVKAVMGFEEMGTNATIYNYDYRRHADLSELLPDGRARHLRLQEEAGRVAVGAQAYFRSTCACQPRPGRGHGAVCGRAVRALRTDREGDRRIPHLRESFRRLPHDG